MLELFKDIWGSLSLKLLYFAAIVGMSVGMYSCGRQNGQNECMIQQVIENQKINIQMSNYKKKLEKIYNEKIDKLHSADSFNSYIKYFNLSISDNAAIMYSKVGKGLQSNTNTK